MKLPFVIQAILALLLATTNVDPENCPFEEKTVSCNSKPMAGYMLDLEIPKIGYREGSDR